MAIAVAKRRLALYALVALGAYSFAGAQALNEFSGRLSWVPVGGAQRADVGGNGSLSASLTRSQLSVSGSFEGMPAAAVSASLRAGVATGARGPVVAELEVTRNRSGSISGEVSLDRRQIAALREGRLYVQVHGESGVEPDNAILWGWLLAKDSSQ